MTSPYPFLLVLRSHAYLSTSAPQHLDPAQYYYYLHRIKGEGQSSRTSSAVPPAYIQEAAVSGQQIDHFHLLSAFLKLTKAVFIALMYRLHLNYP